MKVLEKNKKLSAHFKRLFIYLVFLAAAAYLALSKTGSPWLAIGISAGVFIALLVDMIYRQNQKRNQRKFSTKNIKIVENKIILEEQKPDDE